MKRFWVFFFENYDASGGMYDCIATTDTYIDALRTIIKYRNFEDAARGYDFALDERSVHIFDAQENKIVYNKSRLGNYLILKP